MAHNKQQIRPEYSTVLSNYGLEPEPLMCAFMVTLLG